MDRVEFVNEWRIGDEHGLVHDGLQGDGYIELRMDWKTEAGDAMCALLRVNPWLAYGVSEGARLAIRKPEETEGRCATVQRTLRDDSVVVRVDGMIGETTVNPTPLTVVRTTSPRHEPSTRLLFLQDGACVDAMVEEWPEVTMDVKEGSRHRLRVAGSTTTGWISVSVPSKAEGEPEKENLRPAEIDGGDGEAAGASDEAEPPPPPDQPEQAKPPPMYYSVTSPKPLLVRAGAEKQTDTLGTLHFGTMVRVLEFRELADGTKRAFVDSLAGEDSLITAALNEFNHSVQRFATCAEYEGARANYCEDMVEREEYVEDAITGNLLRIKDQTLHVSTATDVQDNASVPTEWRVNDVSK